MDITKTPLYREARRIMMSGRTDTNYGWKALIHTTETTTCRPLKVIDVSVFRDYVDSFSDEMILTVLMGLGSYAKRVYPNRLTCKVALYKLPLTETGGSYASEVPIDVEVFDATLLPNTIAPTEGQGAESTDEETLNLTQLVEVSFQLINKSVNRIKTMKVGGTYRRVKVGDVLLSILTKESGKADVGDERALLGVDMHPASNKDYKEQIIIRPTALVDVAGYLQEKIGVYSAGMGSFIQNNHWYVYPLYDTTLFETKQKTLTILVLPKRRFNSIETTFEVSGDNITILMTGDTAFGDDNGAQYLNGGNGARFTDAKSVMEDAVATGGNKAIVSRKKNNNEFVTEERPDKVNNVVFPEDNITSNPFKIYSGLASRKGGYFRGVWQNSDSKIITPGMVTRIVYVESLQAQEIYGVVHFCDHISHKLGDFTSDKYSNQSIVTVFVNQAQGPT